MSINYCGYQVLILDNDNLGDRAIYQMIVHNLKHSWPDSKIYMITRNPEVLEEICPTITPLVLSAERIPLSMHTNEVDQYSIATSIKEANLIVSKLKTCNLVLATGGGYFTDAFAKHAWAILDTLEIAVKLSKPTAILSCGFEPIRHKVLIQKMLTVLPKLNLVTCREPLRSPKVLRSFGVSQNAIILSCDEAVELAFACSKSELGNYIGINMRQADYSNIDKGVIKRFGQLMQLVAQEFNTQFCSVPISLKGPSDVEAISYLETQNQYIEEKDALFTLNKVLSQINRCRVVITASYHAAVFALSQGVSVVALISSHHYQAKLEGLKAQFGTGISIVELEKKQTEEDFLREFRLRWVMAERERSQLLESAMKQIQSNKLAYRRYQEMLL